MNKTVVSLQQIIQEEYIGKVCTHKLASIFWKRGDKETNFQFETLGIFDSPLKIFGKTKIQ